MIDSLITIYILKLVLLTLLICMYMYVHAHPDINKKNILLNPAIINAMLIRIYSYWFTKYQTLYIQYSSFLFSSVWHICDILKNSTKVLRISMLINLKFFFLSNFIYITYIREKQLYHFDSRNVIYNVKRKILYLFH